VIAVAQEIEEAKDEPKVVKVITVLLTPEEAERLTIASHDGTLRLALRNYEDKKVVMTNGSNIAAMLRGGAAAPLMEHQAAAPAPARMVARPRPKAIQVEILRDGSKTESVSFVHGRGARNTVGLEQETVGAADPSFEMTGVEGFASAPEAASAVAAAPHGSAAAAGSRHGMRAPAPASAVGFAAAPEDSPLFSGANSKTIDVP